MQWLVNPGGGIIPVEDYLSWIVEHPDVFGVSEEEVRFARTKGDRGVAAIIDKVLSVGWVIAFESSRGELAATFWEEFPAAPGGLPAGHGYRLVEKWIATHRFHPKKDVLLKVRRTGQAWKMTVEALLRGQQYAKNPDRALPCPRCGSQVSKEEVVVTKTCPKCGGGLA